MRAIQLHILQQTRNRTGYFKPCSRTRTLLRTISSLSWVQAEILTCAWFGEQLIDDLKLSPFTFLLNAVSIAMGNEMCAIQLGTNSPATRNWTGYFKPCSGTRTLLRTIACLSPRWNTYLCLIWFSTICSQLIENLKLSPFHIPVDLRRSSAIMPAWYFSFTAMQKRWKIFFF